MDEQHEQRHPAPVDTAVQPVAYPCLEKTTDVTTEKVWSTTCLDIPYPAKYETSVHFSVVSVHTSLWKVRNVRTFSVPNFLYIFRKKARTFFTVLYVWSTVLSAVLRRRQIEVPREHG